MSTPEKNYSEGRKSAVRYNAARGSSDAHDLGCGQVKVGEEADAT
jgi:hypothetical protein